MKKKAPPPADPPASRSLVGDVHAVRSERYDKWALYQVFQHDSRGLGVVTLDWFDAELPAASELGKLKPLLVRNFFQKRPQAEVFRVSDPAIPRHFVRVGNAPPCFEGKNPPFITQLPASGALTAEMQYQWMQVDPSVREAYERAENAPAMIETPMGPLKNTTAEQHIEAQAPFDWTWLDALPMLTRLTVRGKAEGLLAYCARRPLICRLDWKQTGAATLDFSATKLEKLTVDITGVEKIVLSDETDRLALSGDYRFLEQLRIEQSGTRSASCELDLDELKAHALPRQSLPWLRELTVRCDEVDLERVVRAYPRLESLSAFGNPGVVKNLGSVRELTHLRSLTLVDLFGFGAADLPPASALPALERLRMSSVPKEAGQRAKKEYGHLAELKLNKLRGDEWLELNAQNPFRGWDGRDNIAPAHAVKAFDAYKKLAAALRALSPDGTPPETVLPLVEDFTLTFNKMGKKSSLETVEREEIGDVLSGLMKPFAPAVRAAALTAFDDARDF